MPGRPIGACPPVLSGVATLARVPISFELATVLATVSVAGPCEASGRCSMFSFVNSSLDGVRLSSVAALSSWSGTVLGPSSVGTGGSSMISSATGGAGGGASCSASAMGSCTTSGADASMGAGAGSSGGGAGFADGLGTAGLGTGANILAQVFAAGAGAGLGASGFGAGVSVGLDCASSFASLEAGTFQAFDSVVGTEVASAAPPARVPFVGAAPPRLPRNPPRPRSVPRPRPRTLSPPRARPLPLAPRSADAPSVAAFVSLTFERDRSLAFLTSANWETCPGEVVSKSRLMWVLAGRALTLCNLFDGRREVAVRIL